MSIAMKVKWIFCFFFLALLQIGCNSIKKDGAPSGFKLFIAKEPYHVFVDNDFPQKKSMMLLSNSNRIAFRYIDRDNQGKEAAVSLPGVDASIGLNSANHPEDLLLSLSSEKTPTVVLMDINLDGIWDIKIIPSTKQKFILFDSQWISVDVIKSHPFEAINFEGTFEFNTAQGKWIRK